MRRKIVKIVSVLMIMGCLVVCFSNLSFAHDANFNFGSYKSGKVTSNTSLDNATTGIMGAVLQVIRIAGIGISLIMLTYIAIKYMWAAPEDRADFKKSAGYFVLGAVMVFAVSQIFTIIAEFATQNVK